MIFLLPVLGYLIGSISSAILIARLYGLNDPRTVGSGNPGATNILRTGGKMPAVLSLVGDILKGLIPILIAKSFTNEPWILALTGLAAFLGHLFPLFFGLKGGKGVATTLGVLLGLDVLLALSLVSIWLLSTAIFRYSSLSAVLATVASPLLAWFSFGNSPIFWMALIIAGLLLWRHLDNIKRLLNGEESRIKLRKT